METMLRIVERKYCKVRRIWVFDCGIVSEENLAAICKRGGQYLVGTPRSQMRQFEEELSKGRLEAGASRSGSEEGGHSARRGKLYPVPHGRPQGNRGSHSESLLGLHEGRLEAPGANHREAPFERSPQNGTASGTHSSHPSAGERSL